MCVCAFFLADLITVWSPIAHAKAFYLSGLLEERQRSAHKAYMFIAGVDWHQTPVSEEYLCLYPASKHFHSKLGSSLLDSTFWTCITCLWDDENVQTPLCWIQQWFSPTFFRILSSAIVHRSTETQAQAGSLLRNLYKLVVWKPRTRVNNHKNTITWPHESLMTMTHLGAKSLLKRHLFQRMRE